MQSYPEGPRFSIRRSDWKRDRDALRRIRTIVFIEEQDVPKEMEWDCSDADAVHLLAIDTTMEPIGTARLLATGQIGRMAVLRQWRNGGVGTALLSEILRIAREPGRPAPFLNAQVSALPFYLRMGFKPVGEPFEEAGILHRRMIPRAAPSEPFPGISQEAAQLPRRPR